MDNLFAGRPTRRCDGRHCENLCRIDGDLGCRDSKRRCRYAVCRQCATTEPLNDMHSRFLPNSPKLDWSLDACSPLRPPSPCPPPAMAPHLPRRAPRVGAPGEASAGLLRRVQAGRRDAGAGCAGDDRRLHPARALAAGGFATCERIERRRGDAALRRLLRAGGDLRRSRRPACDIGHARPQRRRRVRRGLVGRRRRAHHAPHVRARARARRDGDPRPRSRSSFAAKPTAWSRSPPCATSSARSSACWSSRSRSRARTRRARRSHARRW